MVPMYSDFADDPEWQELLQGFVETIPIRIASIRRATEAGDAAQVKTLVHQLRGACGSYGYPLMTPIATALELELVTNPSLDEHVQQIHNFIEALECIRAGSHAQQFLLRQFS